MIKDSEFVKRRREEGALVLTIDNPPVNALNFDLLEQLSAAINEANEDTSVYGIVITGAGSNAFSAGADLKMIQNLKPDESEKMVNLGHRTFSAIENSKKPTIAAVNGLALGGGNELAMSCDLRFVSDRARFGQTEVLVGLIPAWGGTQRMSRLINKAKAKELIFSGQIIPAQEAFRIGLVNKVVPDGEELRASVDYIRMLAAKASPLAVQQAKLAINRGLQEPNMEKALENELEAIRVLSKSEDLREGVEAFLLHRPPKFTGK